MSEQKNSATNRTAAKSDQSSDTGLTANAHLSKTGAPSSVSFPQKLDIFDESALRQQEIIARNQPSPPLTVPAQPTVDMVRLLLSSPEKYRNQVIGELLAAVGPRTQRSLLRDFQTSQNQSYSETPTRQTPLSQALPQMESAFENRVASAPPGDDGDDSSEGGGDADDPRQSNSFQAAVPKTPAVPLTERLIVPKTVKEAIQSSIIPFQLHHGKSIAGYALDFLESVTDAAIKLECSEKAALYLLESKLDKTEQTTKSWLSYMKREGSTPTTCAGWRTAILSKCKDKQLRDKAINYLFDMQMAADQNYSQYEAAYRVRWEQTNQPDGHLTGLQFLRSLSAPIYEKIIENPTFIHAKEQAALSLELIGELAQVTQDNRNAVKSQEKKINTVKKTSKDKDASKDTTKGSGKQKGKQQQQQSYQQALVKGVESHSSNQSTLNKIIEQQQLFQKQLAQVQQNQQRNRYTPRETVICRKCGGKGHLANVCPTRESSPGYQRGVPINSTAVKKGDKGKAKEDKAPPAVMEETGPIGDDDQSPSSEDDYEDDE